MVVFPCPGKRTFGAGKKEFLLRHPFYLGMGYGIVQVLFRPQTISSAALITE
jgi:hypothetical protein